MELSIKANQYWGTLNIQVKLHWNFPLNNLIWESFAGRRFWLWRGRLQSAACQELLPEPPHQIHPSSLSLLIPHKCHNPEANTLKSLLDSKPQVHTSSQPWTGNSISWPIQLSARNNSIAVTPTGTTKRQMQMVNNAVKQKPGNTCP